MSRPTIAQIDLRALEHNFNLLRRMAGKATKILPVIKADAYGHGIEGISRKLISSGVDYLGVATVDEAVTLRRFFRQSCPDGEKKSILVLGAILPEETDAVLKYDIVQTVADKDIAGELSKKGRKYSRPVKVHVKVDTGMGRIGIWHKDALDFIKWVKALDFIDIEGVWTHFSSADEKDGFYTNGQIHIFRQLIKDLTDAGIDIPLKHIANSMAMARFASSYLNLVRPGLLMYGLYPRRDLKKCFDFRPVMSLKTKIVFLKDVPAGRAISYGRTFITAKPSKIATIAIGYGDGYPRILSGRAAVLVNGIRAPIAGVVCMDQIMIDVTDVPAVKTGDEAVLLGKQGTGEISAEELAELAGTIPYEIVCSVTRRVQRVYIDDMIHGRQPAAFGCVGNVFGGDKNEKNYSHAEKI